MTWFRCGGIPQSVLDLPTVSSASGSIATFDTDLTENLVKCVAQIQAIQSGSGTPSPSNPRAISGFSNCVITANSTPVTISLGQTVYGGYLDVLSGVLTITHGYLSDLSSLTWAYNSTDKYMAATKANNPNLLPNTVTKAIGIKGQCSKYNCIESTIANFKQNNLVCLINSSAFSGNPSILIRDLDYTDATIFKNSLTDTQLIYELATPTTVQLSSNQIATILGQNNIYADTGDIDVEFLETVGNKIGG